MNKYTNNGKISIALAVWLCDDDYDHSNNPNEISATTLLKPIKEIVLARQNFDLDKIVDISSLAPSRMGSALHTAIENTWLKKEKLLEILLSLGYPEHVTKKIIINPKEEELTEDCIAVYLEKRSKKKAGKYIISGKFDFVIEAGVEDFKSMGTYGYTKGGGEVKFIQQGSIYRWLNPKIITSDTIKIHYLFTDWSLMQARKDKNYPQTRLLTKSYQLMSIPETENFINNIVNQVASLESKPQEQLPICTDEELWRTKDVYKYYKDPNKKSRSTKNFDTSAEAYTRLAEDGSVGEVIKFGGQIKKCAYCSVVGICDQAAEYIKSGSLVL